MTESTNATQLSPNARKILEEATHHDGTPPVSDQALLAVAQGRRRLVEQGDAIGIIGEGEVELVVRPTARGKGIGQALLHTLLSNEDLTTELRAWAHGENPPATALLRSAGFEPVRELLRLALDPAMLEQAIGAARPLPDGFEVRAYTPDAGAQADDWVRVNAAAFANHPEQGQMTRADFDALTREPWFAADDLRLAYSTNGEHRGDLAGFTWVKTVREGDTTETELYVLGVDPTFSGIGLGAALLGETLRRMAKHHPERITLYVDGDNTNAVALYARAGFAVEQRSMQYLRAATRPR
mgnify:CR=1 FL=1